MKNYGENKYVIQKKIGEGGSSSVYLAKDRNLGKQWAVKAISKDCSEGIKEALVMKNLSHEGLPEIIDIFEQDRFFYIVMNYIEGHTLREELELRKVSEDELINWWLQICDVLSYLHHQNPPLILCDLKPDNIMISGDKVTIIDLGIACYKEKSRGSCYGTDGYAAPEQYMQGLIDERTDIFSLGKTMENVYQRCTTRNQKVKKIIHKCSSKNPKKRFQNVNEVRYRVLALKKDSLVYQRKQRRKKAGCFACIAGIVLTTVPVVRDRINEDMHENTSELTQGEMLDLFEEQIEKVKQCNDFTLQQEQEILQIWYQYRSRSGGQKENKEQERYQMLCYQLGMLYLEKYHYGNEFTRFLRSKMWFEFAGKTYKMAPVFVKEAEIIQKCLSQSEYYNGTEEKENGEEEIAKISPVPRNILTKAKNSKGFSLPYIRKFDFFIQRGEYIQVRIFADRLEGNDCQMEYYLQENGKKGKVQKVKLKGTSVVSFQIKDSFDGYVYARVVTGGKGEKPSFVRSEKISLKKEKNNKIIQQENLWQEQTEPEEIIQPETTQSERIIKPETTEPEITEPEITEPEITEPETTEPETTEPGTKEPERIILPKITSQEIVKQNYYDACAPQIMKIGENVYAIFDDYGIEKISAARQGKKQSFENVYEGIYIFAEEGMKDSEGSEENLKIQAWDYAGNQSQWEE